MPRKRISVSDDRQAAVIGTGGMEFSSSQTLGRTAISLLRAPRLVSRHLLASARESFLKRLEQGGRVTPRFPHFKQRRTNALVAAMTHRPTASHISWWASRSVLAARVGAFSDQLSCRLLTFAPQCSDVSLSGAQCTRTRRRHAYRQRRNTQVVAIGPSQTC